MSWLPQTHRERLRLASLGTLVLQNSALTLTMRYSRMRAHAHRYHASEAVALAELAKLGISLALAARAEPGGSSFVARLRGAAAGAYAEPGSYVLIVPAALYAVQNNLQYVAASNLEPAVFQLLYQMKLLTTAFFSVLLLGRRLAPRQWSGVGLLAAGLAAVASSSRGPDAAARAPAAGVNFAVGFAAVFAACCTSGFSSVYFERVVKSRQALEEEAPRMRLRSAPPRRKPISVWARNAQMATFSTCIALWVAFVKDGEEIRRRGALAGFSPCVWAVVLLQACGGLCTAAVIAYADNLLKGFATGCSMLLSTLYSWMWLGFEITPAFAAGAVAVLASIYVYSGGGKRA